MSAFLCSDRQTYAVAILACRHELADDVTETAVLFRALNNAGLSSRYPNDPGTMPLQAGPQARREALQWVSSNSPGAHVKAAQCLLYQCAEGPCEQRPGWALLESLIAALEDEARRAGGPATAEVWAF